MKKLAYGIIILALLNSCSQKTEKTLEENEQTEKVNPIADPNLFIGEHKTKAMVLGVFHFQTSQSDSYKKKFPFDILDKRRQSELDTLLDKIAKYKPTKILVEWNRIKMDSITNSWFQEYLNDKTDLSDKRNEVFQIGFKLAKKLNHNSIYCSDASAPWFGAELDWDNYDEESYMQSRGQYEKASRYNYEPFYELHDSLKTVQSLTEHLRMLNDPMDRLKDHQRYLTDIIEGAGDNYLGADNTGRQYRRNLRIFANAYDLTDFDNEERLLLIYGSGHVWQLRQLFTDSPDFKYVEVNDYLTE